MLTGFKPRVGSREHAEVVCESLRQWRSGDCLGVAGESLCVQPGVRLRPVQVSKCECLASVLPIVGHPRVLQSCVPPAQSKLDRPIAQGFAQVLRH